MMSMHEPEIAAALVAKGDVLMLDLWSLARTTGMQVEDFVPFFASGELGCHIMERQPNGPGVRLGVRSDEVIRWMARNKISTDKGLPGPAPRPSPWLMLSRTAG